MVRLHQLHAETHRLVLSFALRKDRRYLEQLDRSREEIEGLVAQIARGEQSERGRRLWGLVEESLAERDRARIALLEALDRGDAEAANRAYERWDLSVATSRALLDDFAAHGLRGVDEALGGLERRRLSSLAALLAVLGVSAIAAVAYAAFVGRRVVGPLARITEAAARIGADGEAHVPGTERDDEIGVLARALERTTGDLVAANARLGEALRARDDFLSIASHELKTPLTPLKLHLEMAARRLAEDGAVPRWLEIAQRQVWRLETLVAQLLDVTSIRAGRLVLHREEADLAAVVEGAAERLGAELARSGARLRLKLAAGVVGRWDAPRLEQVVANLLSNALKHAPGAPVEVVVEPAGAAARLVVRDGGPGVPPALRARLFERFERAQESRNVGGLGLGLYIVRQLVEAHGGRVWLDHGEKGAAFVVELPRVAVHAGSPPGPDTRAAASPEE